MVCTSRSVTSLRDDLAKELGEPRETHISWVFLTGDAVYKVKKPVELGFLDFSTLTAREEACRAEVELNRRLAPDVYHGVVPITREGKTHRVGGDGEVVDWAVHMRRLRDDDRADVLVTRGELSIEHVDRIATTLAEFHAKCRADEETAAFGAPDVVSRNVREAFSATEAAHTLLTPAEADELEGWQLGFLESRRSLFEERAAKGRVRDGHGDVRLEHVYLEGPRRDVIRIIDGIEFNERFRYADVCADLAFLSMDLAWHGRVDLAERALAKYAQVSNDFDLYLLVDFYESYRAYVRAKIASLVAADPSVSSAARQRQREQARRYFKLALAVERPPLIGPMVVAVGGVIASGKSTVADRLGGGAERAAGDPRRLVPQRGDAPGRARPRGQARRALPHGGVPLPARRVSRAPEDPRQAEHGQRRPARDLRRLPREVGARHRAVRRGPRGARHLATDRGQPGRAA